MTPVTRREMPKQVSAQRWLMLKTSAHLDDYAEISGKCCVWVGCYRLSVYCCGHNLLAQTDKQRRQHGR